MTASIAKYRQLADRWRADILAGRWSPESELPPERDLAETHRVSRPTVRAALGVLEQSGLLRREQGRGTFVSRRAGGTATAGVLHLVASMPGSEAVSADSVIAALSAELASVSQDRFASLRVVPVRDGQDLLERLSLCGYPGRCRSGVVFHGLRMPDDAVLRRLARDRVPRVLIGEAVGSEAVASVSADHRGTGAAAARHLLAHGHRRIALLDGPWQHVPCQQRREGFLAEIAAAGASALVVEAVGWDREASARSARRMLGDAERPGAVVVFGDRGAAGLFDVAREAGLQVPRDLAVVAVDIPPSALGLAAVPITAFVPDYAGYAVAVDAALHHQDVLRRLVPDRIIIGRSCGCVAS